MRYASDDDDKNVENFKRMRRYGRNQDGQNKGKGAPRPTALVVIRCKNLCCTAYHPRGNVCSARHTFHSRLTFLASEMTVHSRDPAPNKLVNTQIPSTTPSESYAWPHLHTTLDWMLQVENVRNRLRRQHCAAATNSSKLL